MRLLRKFVKGLSVLWSEDFAEFLGELAAFLVGFLAALGPGAALLWALASLFDKLRG